MNQSDRNSSLHPPYLPGEWRMNNECSLLSLLYSSDVLSRSVLIAFLISF